MHGFFVMLRVSFDLVVGFRRVAIDLLLVWGCCVMLNIIYSVDCAVRSLLALGCCFLFDADLRFLSRRSLVIVPLRLDVHLWDYVERLGELMRCAKTKAVLDVCL